MNYFLTDDQKMIKDLAAQIARGVAIAAELDESGEFPWDVVKILARLTCSASSSPPSTRGWAGECSRCALSWRSFPALAAASRWRTRLRALARSRSSSSAATSRRRNTCRGSPREKSWPPSASPGPGRGATLHPSRPQRSPDGDSYVINGTKQWITNGGEASIYTVVALTDPLRGTRGSSTILVDKGDPGFTFGKKENKDRKYGPPRHGTELVFQDCRVPKSNLLGKEGMGFSSAMKTLDQSRPGVASQALGIAQGAMDQAVGIPGAPPVRQAHLAPSRASSSSWPTGHPGRGSARPDIRGRAEPHRYR